MFLLAGSLVIAAPVPKIAPTMTERFGEPTVVEEECVAVMGRSGTQKLTMPTTTRVVHPTNVVSIGPLVAKSVEGDFTPTARLTLDIPDGAKSKDRNNPAGLAAGLCAYVAGERDGYESCVAVTVGRHDVTQEQPSYFEYHWKSRQGGGSHAGSAEELKTGAPVYLRGARKGDEVTTAYSAGGKKWYETGKHPVAG